MDRPTCYSYYKKFGAKFTGTDGELQSLVTDCKHQLAWTDEEGFFDSFICLKDSKKCIKNCGKHHPKINDDIAEFFYATNERLKQCGE